MIREARESGRPDEEIAPLIEHGEELQRRWGCPAAGHTPPTTLDDTAAYPLGRTTRLVARTIGLAAPPETCPLACVERAEPWVVEVTRACQRAAGDLKRPIERTLGRATTAADEAAIGAWDDARNAATWSDHEHWKRQREKPKT